MLMLLALVVSATLPGCARTAPDPCSLFNWIELPEADEMTASPELIEQIAAHNRVWLGVCEP
jgi:hypothetical protein